MQSSPKKIILVGPAHPFRGGIASTSERLIKQFQLEGHEAEIFTFTLQYPGFLFPGKTQFSEDPAPEGIKISRKVSSVNPFNWMKVGKEIKRLKPDILIFRYWLPFMGPCFGKIARIAKKNKHTKIITIFDNLIPHEKRFGDKIFTSYFVKPNDAFIAMSKSVLDDFDLFDTVKPRALTPHPLFDTFGPTFDKQESKEFLGLDPNLNYILFFGIIRDYKGLDLLLEAYKKMDYKSKNIRLLVVGEFYSNEEKYRAQIQSLGLEDDITLVDRFVKDSEVGRFFCASDIIAQPYKSATQSGVAQIAYHFEIPMLVTNVGGLPEIVPHGKVGYVTTQSPEDIAAKLSLFYDESKEEEFKANIKIEKEKYSWDKLSAKVINMYNEVTSSQ